MEPNRLTGSVVAGFEPKTPLAGLSALGSAGFEPKRFTGGTSDFGAVDDPKRFTAGLDAVDSAVGLPPNKPPPDGASSFFLSSVGAEAVDGFDPNNPPEPKPGFGRAGFSFSVSAGGAVKLMPPPDGFR